MAKTKRRKPKIKQKQFATLAKAQDNFYKEIKKVDKKFTRKKARQLLNKNTITASKNLGYSFNKVQKKAIKYLEKNTQLSDSDILKATANISRAAILKRKMKEIFNDNWELGKNDPQLLKNYKNLFKIVNYIETNNLDIFRYTKLITDANGRKYTFIEALTPTKDYINKIKNVLINIDDVKLEYWAKLKNLKRGENILNQRHNKEKGKLGTYTLSFEDIDFTKSDNEILAELDQIEAHYFDKTGYKDKFYTKYFEIQVEYLDSEEYKVTTINFKNNHATDQLARIFAKDTEEAYDEIAKDLADFYGLGEYMVDFLHGGISNTIYNQYENKFEQIFDDAKKLINILLLKIKGNK